MVAHREGKAVWCNDIDWHHPEKQCGVQGTMLVRDTFPHCPCWKKRQLIYRVTGMPVCGKGHWLPLLHLPNRKYLQHIGACQVQVGAGMQCELQTANYQTLWMTSCSVTVQGSSNLCWKEKLFVRIRAVAMRCRFDAE